MGRCDVCGRRLPGDVHDWCPVCGASLHPDPGSWELGAATPRPAGARVGRAAESSAASPPGVEFPRRRHRRGAAWFVAALALLGGVGACAYLLATFPLLDDAGATSPGVSIYVGSSAGAGPSTTMAKNTEAAVGFAGAADATRRFLAYDAASGKYGYADETGTMVIAPRFDQAGRFAEGLAPVQFQDDYGESGYGYIDTTGALVIEPQFSKASAFSEGLARVEMEIDGLYRYGFIDRSGSMAILPRYIAAWDFSEGLARVGLNDASGLFRFGFIDQSGTMVIDPRFESARDFCEGLAAVAIEDRWGYIDRTGVWAIEPQFYDALSFMPSGLAWVDLEDPGTAPGEVRRVDAGRSGLHQALIDKTGRVVSEREEGQGQ